MDAYLEAFLKGSNNYEIWLAVIENRLEVTDVFVTERSFLKAFIAKGVDPDPEEEK